MIQSIKQIPLLLETGLNTNLEHASLFLVFCFWSYMSKSDYSQSVTSLFERVGNVGNGPFNLVVPYLY